MEDKPGTVNQSTLFLTDLCTHLLHQSNCSGGFTDIARESYPEFDTSKSQNDPMLRVRSFKGASIHNLVHPLRLFFPAHFSFWPSFLT